MPNRPRDESVGFRPMILTVALVAVLYLAVQGAGTVAMMIVGGIGVAAAWMLPFFRGGGDEEPVEFRITAPGSGEDGPPPAASAGNTDSAG